MASESLSIPRVTRLAPELRHRERRSRLITLLLLSPAIALVVLFMVYPLAFIVRMSFTLGSSFLSPHGAVFTLENYGAMAGRYVSNIVVTVQLAGTSMLVNLVFGFPFAYILVRKVHYRDIVRAFMVFPMFGALYVAFGMRFILLPGGPASPLF